MPAFIPVHPPRNPDQCEPWLYEAITRLNRHASGTGQAIGAIVQGYVPDSSGVPLPAPDLSAYFKLIGRSTDQVAYGSINSAGNLTLGSTSSTTKGKIFFGSAATFACFDEANSRFGIGTVTPSVMLHL